MSADPKFTGRAARVQARMRRIARDLGILRQEAEINTKGNGRRRAEELAKVIELHRHVRLRFDAIAARGGVKP